MLGDLLASLADTHPLFGVFQYVTVRTAAAAATAIALSLGAGGPMIARLRRMQIGETIREDGPAHHHKKAGTPTMGGVLIVASITIATLLWADLGNPLIGVALVTVLACAGIGIADDLRKLRRGRGIAGRTKFLALAGVSLAVGVFLVLYAGTGAFTTRLVVPFLKDFTPDLGWLLVIGTMAVLTASTNAVNLTDGLDGLASGTVLIAGGAFTILTYLSGHAVFSEYLYIVHVPGGSELTVFGAALCGATLGFLWFNAHPAQVFMGDVGALALGAAVGVQALLIRQELLLIFVGGVFVLEAGSVLLQVASFQLRGRRILRMSPLHHHLELGGWSETQVSVRLWIVGVLCALATLVTVKIR